MVTDRSPGIERYTLKTPEGQWLGDIVITEDGRYFSITDWGNFSYIWNSIGDRSFKEFLLGINIDYFASKMFAGMAYVTDAKKVRDAAGRYALHILPEFQRTLREEKIPPEKPPFDPESVLRPMTEGLSRVEGFG